VVQVARERLANNPSWSYVEVHLGLLALLAIVGAWLSTRAFNAYQRSG
jgi:hypothetical protein